MMILVKKSIRQKGKERKIFAGTHMQRDDQKCEREYSIRENKIEYFSRENVEPSWSVVVSQ